MLWAKSEASRSLRPYLSLSAVHSPSRIGCSEDCWLLLVGVQPVFEAIKWAGFADLAFMAFQALRSAQPGRYLPFDDEKTRSTRTFLLAST
jgi:hypothetical protein